MTLRDRFKTGLWKVSGRALGIDAGLQRIEKHHREALGKASDRHRQELNEVVDRLATLEAAHAEALGELTKVGRMASQLVTAHHADAERAKADLGDEFNLEEIEAHARTAVTRAPMQTDPFPYLVVPDLLPKRLYRRLLKAIPGADYWEKVANNRENWFIGRDVADARTEAVWSFMQTSVAPRVLQPLFVDAFREHLRVYWREAFDLDASLLEPNYFHDEGRLLLRRPGYKLGPHLDPNHAVLTVLIYLARPGHVMAHGTDLYRSGPIPPDRRGIFRPEEHDIPVELAITVPFQANTALVFITPISVHGAELPVEGVPAGFERVSYQFMVCLRRVVRERIAQGAAS